MKLAKLSIYFGVTVGFIITAAESQTTTGSLGESSANLSWSKPTIRMARDVVRVGDEIRLFTDRTNITRQPILTGSGFRSTAARANRIQVRDEKGELAPETRLGRFVRTGKREPGDPATIEVGKHLERYVQPGGTYTDVVYLSDLYELLQPGKYTAQIVDVDEKGSVTFESNKATFTITK